MGKIDTYLIIVIFLVGVLPLPGFSQNGDKSDTLPAELVSHQEKQMIPVQEALLRLEQHYDVLFLYDSQLINDKRIHYKQPLPSDVLEAANELLKGYEVRVVRLNDHSYAILPESNPQQSVVQRFQVEVEGTVTDAQSGETLPGVNVIVKGTTTGTSTDSDGNFELTVESLQDTLVFSFVGYQTQEVPINGRTEIDVVLQSQAIAGEELVVVGYGTQKRANLTGAVDFIGSESIEGKPVGSTGEALQGVIPNLNVEIRSGEPGAEPTYNIRGFESITGGSPLFLVNGVPRDPNSVNPDNIDQVTVLKDAAAAAVYGSRAAFGVVLIETKGAEPGDFQVSFDGRFSAERPIWNVDPVEDPYRYITWMNKAVQRATGSNRYSDVVVEQTKRYSENPTPENAWIADNGMLNFTGSQNFSDMLLRDFVPMQDYNLDISGGQEDANYYASIGYKSEEGLSNFNPRTYDRYNIILDANLSVTDWLTLGENVQYNVEQSNNPHNYGPDWHQIQRFGTLHYAGGFPSTDLFEEPDYPGRDYSDYEGMYIHNANFVPYYEQGGRDKTNRGELYLSQKIVANLLNNLEIRADFTYNITNERRTSVQSRIEKLKGNHRGQIDLLQTEMIGPGRSEPTYVTNDYIQNHYYVLNALAEYEFDEIQTSHYVKAMVGFNQEWLRYNGGGTEGYDMITPTIGSANATVGDQRISAYERHMALRGVFTRLNYIYDDRYLIEFNGRYDGTSRFPQEDRFGFFPSLSVGWAISEESFMDEVDFLSNLKIRGSYGELGNQDISSYYPYISTMNMGMANYLMDGNRVPYVSSPGLVSPSLTWEKTETSNIGIDIGFFEDKLAATFDTYIRATKDMLMNVDYPDFLGTSAPDQNAANLETRGWEFKLTYRNTIGDDWNYQLAFNISDNVTEITKYDNPTGAISDYYEGQKIGEIWGYETVGIFQSEEEVENAADQSRIAADWRPGDIRYRDLNGDGEITPGQGTINEPGDRKIIGNSSPRYSYGLDFDVGYKGLSVGLFLQGIGQRDYYPPHGNHRWFWPFNAGLIEEYHITESWTEDNRNAYFHAPNRNSSKNIITQTRYLQNAAYIRFKNLNIGYEIPSSIISKIGLRRLQVYVAAQNLAEYSVIHEPLDPEYVYSSTVPYPLQRTYSVGTRISF